MAQFESGVKYVPYSQEQVFNKLSDLSNLESVRDKCVKFESEKSPVPMNLWIQILPVEAGQAKLKVTIRAEVNMFMKAMVAKPLQDGVDKLAEMLSMIPY